MLIRDVAIKNADNIEEVPRWEDMASLEKAYLKKLKDAGLEDIHQAKIKNLANSLPMQMSHSDRFTQLSITLTFGYNRVKDCRSYEEIEKCIRGQASSAKKFLQKIRDSKHFRSKGKSKCPLDKQEETKTLP